MDSAGDLVCSWFLFVWVFFFIRVSRNYCIQNDQNKKWSINIFVYNAVECFFLHRKRIENWKRIDSETKGWQNDEENVNVNKKNREIEKLRLKHFKLRSRILLHRARLPISFEANIAWGKKENIRKGKKRNIHIQNAFIPKCQFCFFSALHVCACFFSVIIFFCCCLFAVSLCFLLVFICSSHRLYFQHK